MNYSWGPRGFISQLASSKLIQTLPDRGWKVSGHSKIAYFRVYLNFPQGINRYRNLSTGENHLFCGAIPSACRGRGASASCVSAFFSVKMWKITWTFRNWEIMRMLKCNSNIMTSRKQNQMWLALLNTPWVSPRKPSTYPTLQTPRFASHTPPIHAHRSTLRARNSLCSHSTLHTPNSTLATLHKQRTPRSTLDNLHNTSHSTFHSRHFTLPTGTTLHAARSAL